MEVLEIPASVKNAKTVGVKFSPDGKLTIHGVSCDEDPKPLYQQLSGWIKGYLEEPQAKTELFIRLKYFNTSSARCLMDLMKLLTKIDETGNELEITWYYEDGDEDMLDAIRVFEALIHHPIEPVVVFSYS